MEDGNPTKKRKVLVVFDDMIANMEFNKTISSIVTELFLRRRKLKILFVSITESYFKMLKTIRLIVTHYFVMKIRTKRELQ